MFFEKPKLHVGRQTPNYNSNPNLLNDGKPTMPELSSYQNMEYTRSPYEKMRLSNQAQSSGNNLQMSNHRRNTTLEPIQSSYDPFVHKNPRKSTTRKQRLKLQDDLGAVNKSVNYSMSNANIYYPGEQKLSDENFDQGHTTQTLLKNRRLNRSQNMSYYSQNLEESPKERGMRIQKAAEDHIRDGSEPSRYLTRLDQSNRKQRAIFDKHY